jgi:hypothetical protein
MWTLTVRNHSDQALGLTFRTNQYGNVVVRRAGRVVYSWDSRRGFFHAFTYRTLAPHETFACALTPDELDFGSLERGRYQVLAYLNTYPFSVRARHSFSITDG